MSESREKEIARDLVTVRELVQWARDGFDPAFPLGKDHGLYLRHAADRALAAGRLAPWEHFLFLAALCQRKDVSLVHWIGHALCASAVRVELAGAGEGTEAYHRVRRRLDGSPDTAWLAGAVAAAVAQWFRTREAAAREAERQREIQSRREARASFEATVRGLIAAVERPPYCLPTPTLALADVQLALAWTLGSDVEVAARNAPTLADALARYGKDPNFRRNLSARAAERAAAAAYERLYPGDVRDVAGSADSSDWKTHDLLAGGRPIDVKNVRHWVRRDHPVEEARVASFKTTDWGQPVTIAGMRSRLVEPRILVDPGPDEYAPGVEFLGETDEATLEGLAQEFDSEVLSLDFSRRKGDDERYLPHWVFEYPGVAYAESRGALSRVTRDLFLDRWFWQDAHLHPLAVALAAGLNVTGTPAAGGAAGWQKDFFSTLLRRRRSLAPADTPALSRPVLYLSVLEHFLRMMGEPAVRRAAFDPSDYREILFFTEKNDRWPGGTYDPRGTIAELIEVLLELWRRGGDLSNLRQFRLTGSGILEGREDPGDRWRTLVAYCGDCEFSPLVFGTHTLCPNCRKLVCRKCNFCSPPGRRPPQVKDPARSCCGGPRDAPRRQERRRPHGW